MKDRCASCGKPLEEGTKAVNITRGTIQGGRFTNEKLVGNLHNDCFISVTTSPTEVLQRIKKLAKKNAKARAAR